MSYFWTERKTRTARKPHRCIWCGDAIPVKSVYVYQPGIFHLEFQANHYHTECAAALDEEAAIYGPIEFTPYSQEREYDPA